MHKDDIERLKGLEELFVMLNRQAEEIRHDIIKRLGLTDVNYDLHYDCVDKKPRYVVEGLDDGVSCGYVCYESIDELLKYHVIEED